MSADEKAAAHKWHRQRRQMLMDARSAFGDMSMLDHASLVVWTRGQMNGIRATIKRLKMVPPDGNNL